MFSPYSSSNLSLFKSSPSSQSRIETIHSNAKTILNQKNQEIEKYKIEIDETEKELLRLKSILKSMQAGTEVDQEDLSNDDESDETKKENSDEKLFIEADDSVDIEEIKAIHQEEIEEINSKYSYEIGSLQIYFSKTLKEAERIAEQHAETLYLEKKSELDETLRKIDLIEAANEETQFKLSSSKIQKMQQQRTTSMLNSIKIDRLNQELFELSALSRTELRDIRAKVDECFLTAEIRQKDHENEMNRLINEIENRENLFSSHYASVVQNYEAEKQKLTEQLQQYSQKISELRKSYKNIQTQHTLQEKQLSEDIQKLKLSVTVSKKGRDQASSMIQSNVVKHQHLQREIKQIENDIVMVDKEIQQIQIENAQIKEELKRIQTRKFQSP